MANRKRKSGKRITVKAVQATENDPPPPAEVALTFKPEEDAGAWNEEGLTKRMFLFVNAYVGEAGGNATDAAAIAGYSAENRNGLAVTGNWLLRNIKIREAIARRLGTANLTTDWIKGMSAALAASNMNTFLDLDDAGEPFIDWRRARALGAFVQIRKYKEKGLKYPGADGQSKVDIIERTIETHNPSPHLDRLAKMLGILKDNGGGTTVNVNVGKPEVDYEAIESELQRIAQRTAMARRVTADN